MKKLKAFLSKSAVTGTLFALAILLLAGSTVGVVRAALNIQSNYYNSRVKVLNIGVALVEKNKDDAFVTVSGDNALMGANSPMGKAIKEDGKLVPGKKYSEVLAVRNVGNIPEYVRVSVYKYWLDENGKKFSDLNSDWIELGFVTNGGWSIDKDSSTEERTVLYYKNLVDPGATTSEFLSSVKINNKILNKVTQETYTVNGVTVIQTTFMYNGKQFCIDVYVDSVQDHNYADAKVSAWGVNK